MGSLLMHASIPITHAFFQFALLSFLFSLLFPCSTSIYFHDDDTSFLMILYYSQLPPFILSAIKGFAAFTPQLLLAPCGCPSKTAHWPAGCPTTTITLNVLVAPFLIPKQNGLSCFLPSSVLTTLTWIRIKPLPHLPLWHALSGPSSFLLLLREMPSQQDISPKEV